RIHSRGHVNKKLAGMILEGESPAERHDSIRVDEKEIGKVTSSVLSPSLKRPIALGYVHRDYTGPGTKVSIHRNGIAVRAVVSSLPFQRRSA
ncbi:MAG: glycine cleavage T C-terminal barrel domain-containing protein, partial [Candidatus Binatia bacterium]